MLEFPLVCKIKQIDCMGDLLQTQRYVINASNCLDLLASLIKVHKMSKTKVPTIDQKCNFRGTAIDYTGMYVYKKIEEIVRS